MIIIYVMSFDETGEHNLCCICMETEGTTDNFSYWSCPQHAEYICNECRNEILSHPRETAICPLCRSPPMWDRITSINARSYISLERERENFVIDRDIEDLILNYINLNNPEPEPYNEPVHINNHIIHHNNNNLASINIIYIYRDINDNE